MPVTYDKIQRVVYLRGNGMAADDAATLATNYANTAIGATELGSRAIEFPALAINDAIANAMQTMVGWVGLDKNNPYRNFFGSVTTALASGALIPNASSASKPRIGIIGDVKDSATSEDLLELPKQNVLSINAMTLKQDANNFFTDNVRIWHTRPFVVCDIVIFSTTDELAAMVASPRGTCPFPDDLLEPLILGALSLYARASFNAEQSLEYDRRWKIALQALGFNFTQMAEARIATD